MKTLGFNVTFNILLILYYQIQLPFQVQVRTYPLIAGSQNTMLSDGSP